MARRNRVQVVVQAPEKAPSGAEVGGRRMSFVDVGSPMAQTAAQRRRRSAPISAYVGLNGSAKTATAVRDVLPNLAAGQRCLGTVALLRPERADSVEHADDVWGRLAEDCGIPSELPRPDDLLRLPHPLWVPLWSWGQVPEFSKGVLLMDEVQGLADAREHSSLPYQISNAFFQMRRAEVLIRWTTIDYTAADKRLRRATQVVNKCMGIVRKRVPGQIWPTYRVFYVRTYDGRGFDDFESAAQRRDKDRQPMVLAREFCRIPGRLKVAVDSYDSGAGVLALGEHMSGICMACNGKRSVPRCSCADAGEARTPRAPRKRSEEGTGVAIPGGTLDQSERPALALATQGRHRA